MWAIEPFHADNGAPCCAASSPTLAISSETFGCPLNVATPYLLHQVSLRAVLIAHKQKPRRLAAPGFPFRFCCHALRAPKQLRGESHVVAHGRVIVRTYVLLCLAQTSIVCRTYFAPINNASRPVASLYRPKHFHRPCPRCAVGGGAGYRPRVQTNSF